MKDKLYETDEETLISFSGGRTSAYMLYRVLEAYDFELPDNFCVHFANTGKEMPQTYDFINRCSDEWNVKITWLEYGGRERKLDSEHYNYFYNVVDYETASRNGEPFKRLISDTGALPNPMSRTCSGQMKIRTMRRYLENEKGWEAPFQSFIGIRADEKRRAIKIHNKISEGQECWCPLYADGVTVDQIADFWRNSSFDLELPNNNGVTDWGNCDLCFLKGRSKRLSIIRERPDLADWWIEVENNHNDVFDRNGLTYERMKIIATDQQSMDFGDDHTIPCFCGE